MRTWLVRSALILSLAVFAAGCNNPQPAQTATPAAATAPAAAAPDATVMASVHALRANNAKLCKMGTDRVDY